MKFKIGDRVRVINTLSSKVLSGYLGNVVHIESPSSIGVEFDNEIEGHDCSNHGQDGYCWYGDSKELVLVEGKRGRKTKQVPIVKHIVIEGSFQNVHGGIVSKYQEAEDAAKRASCEITIYKLVEVAQVKSERKVFLKRQVVSKKSVGRPKK